jgi:hypothetical protein
MLTQIKSYYGVLDNKEFTKAILRLNLTHMMTFTEKVKKNDINAVSSFPIIIKE